MVAMLELGMREDRERVERSGKSRSLRGEDVREERSIDLEKAALLIEPGTCTAHGIVRCCFNMHFTTFHDIRISE